MVAILSINLLPFSVSGETDHYYWYDDEKFYLDSVDNQQYLLLDDIQNEGVLKEKLDDYLVEYEILEFLPTKDSSSTVPYKGSEVQEYKRAKVESEELADTNLAEIEEVRYIGGYYKPANSVNDTLGLSHKFYVKIQRLLLV